MRSNGLSATPKRRFVVTTDSNHDLDVAENVLNREFHASAPNTKWTGDITYIWTLEGWLYLAVVLDLYSRRVVGWAMGETIDRHLVLAALNMAVGNRAPTGKVLMHSDRGSQYASTDHRERLRGLGFECSMSRKGNCWDNAPTESFFASLKKGLIYRRRYETRREAKLSIFSWIEVWYNQKRRHTSIGSISPAEFERRNANQFVTQKAA